MRYSTSTAGDRFIIAVEGEMTFTDSDAFDGILRELEASSAKECRVDLEKLDFIDSAGLRLLLLLHRLAAQKGIDLTLSKPRGEVAERLSFAKFETIVAVEGTPTGPR